MKAFICGCAGLELSHEERAFLAGERPWGFILFKRNVESPAQVAALVAALRDAVGRADAPVLIDQEGGRVQRLAAPYWPAYPAGAAYGQLAARNLIKGLEATRLGMRLIADDLHRLGIDVDCVPLLDVPVAGAHDVIGARAFSRDPAFVTALARAAADGVLTGGVLPVIKHMPGHGRAGVDSHHGLPVVDTALETLAAQDFAPFAALADLPLAMSAHVVYTAIDPDRPATTSARVIGEIIRGRIGFDGALMTDDLSMQALGGDHGARARAALDAGCDLVLHCNGKMDEMRQVAEACPELGGAALARVRRAEGWRKAPAAFDRGAGEARLADLMAEVGVAFCGTGGAA